ncbi:MAG: aspartate kinase [Bacteroidales bacterium]
MIIAKAVDIIISRSPFLEEALRDNLVNLSSLARKIKPEVEEMTRKQVKESAIVMAISRRPESQAFRISKGIRTFISGLGDIIVRSGLSDHTFENSPGLAGCQRRMIEEMADGLEVFYTFSQGVYETTLVAGSSLDKRIREIFHKEKLLSFKDGLSSVTLLLPKNNTEISGIYYYILKQLAWAGINVCEVVSTSNEVTIVVSEADVKRAFPILMEMKKNP